jgi:RNA polymerase sigma-70 factor, ECF subfamily
MLPAVADRTDRDIVDAVRAGQRNDFEVLVRRHNQRLFRAARAVSRSDQDAEDVLQQTWLAIFKNLGSFRGDAAFTTWATRIAINEAIAHARKKPVIAEVKDMPSDVTPDDDVERAQLGRLLATCLDTIPQGHREVIVLRDVLELDTAETAECLGLSEEAVRVRLHRARAAVAAALAERMTEEARTLYSFDGARCDRVTAWVMARL